MVAILPLWMLVSMLIATFGMILFFLSWDLKLKRKENKFLELEKELERKNQIIADCQCVLDDFEIIVEILEDNFIEEEINEMINKKKDLREKDLNKFLGNVLRKDE
jgi:hypothetical protein